MKSNIYYILGMVLLITLGCNRDKQKKLYAPMSHEDIGAIVKPGMSESSLIERCGAPFNIRKKDGIKEIEFMLSFDHIKRSDWIISSFIVVLSNDTVVSWRPYATGRVR